MSNNNIKTEMLYLLRNNDVMTITERGVTTQTDTDTLSSADTYLINRSNVKNVRSLSVDSTDLEYGRDYTLNLDYDDSGTVKCQVSFNSTQSGELEIIYDYGTDKIFGDFPRDDLTLNTYPRIACEMISKSTDAFGIGAQDFISNIMFTVVLYSESADYIQSKIETIESVLRTNTTGLYYVPYTKPIGQGPLIKSEDRNDIILQKNVDIMAMFQVE